MGIFSMDNLDMGPPPPRVCFVCKRFESELPQGERVVRESWDDICTVCAPRIELLVKHAFSNGVKAGRIEAGATPKMTPREHATAEFYTYKEGDTVHLLFPAERVDVWYRVLDSTPGALTLEEINS